MENTAMVEIAQKQPRRGGIAKKCFAMMMALVLVLSCVPAAFAAETGTQEIVDASAYSSLFDILTAQLNVESIVGVIAAILGVCVGLVFLWWGARKALRMLMSAFKKGKVSI